MVHLLVYADCFDIEGLVSSPYGPGRKEHILEVIDCYEKDYANLKTYSDKYPPPDCVAGDHEAGRDRASLPTPACGTRPRDRNWIVTCAQA